jgi:predicted nucleic acid-binding protein
MTRRVFVDTNVLVYGRDASEPGKQPRAWAWREALWKLRAGRLSIQVLQEYYQVVTRKLKPGLTRPVARQEITDLSLWKPVVISESLLESSWEIEDRFKISFWDSLIVAAAWEADCESLLSEDLSPGTNFDGLKVIDPFATLPADVLDG